MVETILKNNNRIIIFDGICKFCSASLHFIYKRDRHALFKFTTTQSATGKRLLQFYNLPMDDIESFVYIEQGRPYYKSDAILRIAATLPWPWPLILVFKIVPLFIRNACYDLIATHRYKIIGKRQTCMIPTGDLIKRFI